MLDVRDVGAEPVSDEYTHFDAYLAVGDYVVLDLGVSSSVYVV